ncbi:MAG: cupin domain-containing protein, partial [Vallitaleaceae bacterium]|nr:cupin domain-containing protein [Vallitaleaceae bacterium]
SDLKSFFHDTEDTQVVFSPNDYFENLNQDLRHTIQWVIPNAQKNTMEPLIITLAPKGSSLKYLPHSGENFGYVLKGSLTLYLGAERYKIKKGESFYFEAKKEFYLYNDSKSDAELLLVSSPPNF